MSTADSLRKQAAPPSTAYDVESVRAAFPILRREVHGKPLVYLDNAATTHKPRAVIDATRRFYEEINSNVHRGVHHLSQEATEAFEAARRRVQTFLGAADEREIVFVRGTTEAINLVAQSYGRATLGEGDEILLTGMEHHSNIVPWQMLCEQTGATLKVVPIDDRGMLRMDELERLLSERTKLVSVVHVSNALGTVNPVERIAAMAHACGAKIMIDGAQAVPHRKVDVRALDADFYAFSGHKTYGPTGIGALYARAELLEAMPPYQGGGDMIRSVSFEKTVYNVIPFKFEAGTPNIAGAVGLARALDYLESLDIQAVEAHERDIVGYATSALESVPDVRLIGTAPERAGAISFLLDGIHPHDVGTILDQEGIAVRTGHHCAQPVMEHFGVAATARASFGVYNTREEVDMLVRGLQRVREVFA